MDKEVKKARHKHNQRTKSQRQQHRPGKGQLLNAVELAAALGESKRTIINWTQRGVLPVIVIGRRTRRYRISDVLEKLGRRTVKGARPRP